MERNASIFSAHLESVHKVPHNQELLFKLSQLNEDSVIKISNFVSFQFNDQLINSFSDGKVEEIVESELSLELVKNEIEEDFFLENQLIAVKYEIDSEDAKCFLGEEDQDSLDDDSKQQQCLNKITGNSAAKRNGEVIQNQEKRESILPQYCPEYDKKSKKGKKCNRYTPVERRWCVDQYEMLLGSKKKWEFIQQNFRTQFPGRSVPDVSTCLKFIKKQKKFNTVEDRLKGKKAPKPGPKSSVCDVCGFVGNTRRKITYHMRQYHSEEKPCDVCGKLVRNMKTHILLRHTSESEKKFHCCTCGKGFMDSYKLYLHELTHGEFRPFVCQYSCGYSCKDKGNLGKHEILCLKRQQKLL